MLTPVPSTLPASNLTLAGIAAKFSPQTLAGLGRLRGLGCDCSDLDPETGDCLDPEPCSSDSSETLSYPADTGVTATPTVTLTPVTSSNGASQTAVSSTPASTGLTASQQAALYSQLTAAGVDLAALGLVQPGTSSNALGISRQATGATIQGTPLTGVVSTGGSGGLLLLLLLGVGAVLLVSEEKRK